MLVLVFLSNGIHICNTYFDFLACFTKQTSNASADRRLWFPLERSRPSMLSPPLSQKKIVIERSNDTHAASENGTYQTANAIDTGIYHTFYNIGSMCGSTKAM